MSRLFKAYATGQEQSRAEHDPREEIAGAADQQPAVVTRGCCDYACYGQTAVSQRQVGNQQNHAQPEEYFVFRRIERFQGELLSARNGTGFVFRTTTSK